jgi:hypothetical protein
MFFNYSPQWRINDFIFLFILLCFLPKIAVIAILGCMDMGGDIAKNQIPLFTRNPIRNKEIK